MASDPAKRFSTASCRRCVVTRSVSSAAGGASLRKPVRRIWRIVLYMAWSLQVVSAVAQVERLVDQWKIGNDVADNRVLEHRPVLPGRIVRMQPMDAAVRRRLERDEYFAAP